MNHARVIQFAPLIWLSGLTPVAYQFSSVWYGLRSGRSLRTLNVAEICLVGLISAYLLSIVSAVYRGEEIIRAIAALYNLSIWVMGLFIVFAYRKIDPVALRQSARFLLVLVLVLSWAAVLVPGIANSYPTLLSQFLNVNALPVNFRNNTTLTIFGSDWSTFGRGFRLSILAPYPTAYAMLVFLLTCLAWPINKERGRTMFLFVIVPLSLYAVFAMGTSRAVTGAFVLYLLLRAGFYFVALFKKSQRSIVAYALALTLALGVIAASAYVTALWEGINQSRAGSSELRFRVYELSIKSVLDQHPLLGFGVKHREDNITVIPIGSHSTFISIFYKSGLLGFIALLGFVANYVFQALRLMFATRTSAENRSLAAGVVSFIPVLAFDDIDALPLNAFIYFTMVGLVLNQVRSLVSTQKPLKSQLGGESVTKRRSLSVRL